jgi:hypothetical protein
MFELDFVIKRLKPVRWISLASAIVYILQQLFSVAMVIYYGDFGNWTQKSLFVVWLEMLFAYNMFMDLFALPVNLSIIIKEATMACFQCFKKNAGKRNDKMSLRLTNLNKVFWFLNPVELVKWIQSLFT